MNRKFKTIFQIKRPCSGTGGAGYTYALAETEALAEEEVSRLEKTAYFKRTRKQFGDYYIDAIKMRVK